MGTQASTIILDSPLFYNENLFFTAKTFSVPPDFSFCWNFTSYLPLVYYFLPIINHFCGQMYHSFPGKFSLSRQIFQLFNLDLKKNGIFLSEKPSFS